MIFEIFFHGAKFDQYEGFKELALLNPNTFNHWLYILDKAISDFSDGKKETNNKSHFEKWGMIVKRII